ncbi:MAG: aminoglycoside phosphotransferase family protein [Atopostipes suicloacalis]|nr:aminoglycoside phosphotransferase family protein [Atopostipes suicloacalis]MDN6730645.1 aminoglycoside phosphotransferase family protein [Atopostipes suicloacalis]
MEKIVLAERSDKVIYRQGDKVIKKFGSSYTKSDILNETLNHSRMEEIGIQIPHLEEVRLLEDERAIVMEYIEGKTLEELIHENPEKIDEYLELFVDLQMSVHKERSPLLNKLHDKMRRKMSETGLNATIRYELDARLAGMPKHNKVCHGDFIPSNIMITDEGEAYILDWSHVTQGNASQDVARTYLRFYLNDEPEIAEKYRNLFAEKSNTAIQYILKWIPIVAASQLVKKNEEEREFLMKWIDVVEYE